MNQEITALLQQEGCDLVGFADLSVLPTEPRKGLPVGIIMATPYAPQAVWEQLSEAQRQRIRDKSDQGSPLERYVAAVKAFLRERNYKRNTTYPSMEITHKMLATLAGLGWIGKNALLVSHALGPAVRFAAVLTDAPLECGTPIMASQCPPGCTLCATACPAQAIRGGLWERGVHRDEFFDVTACKEGRSTCGTPCIAVCPFAQQGLSYTAP